MKYAIVKGYLFIYYLFWKIERSCKKLVFKHAFFIIINYCVIRKKSCSVVRIKDLF